MRENIIQAGATKEDGRTYIPYDWYTSGMPGNITFETNVYIDTSYGFAAFHSEKQNAMRIGEGTGCYDRSSFITGKDGEISIGSFTILNGTTIISNKKIEIGSHCMLAWGSVITDTWLPVYGNSVLNRQSILKKASQHSNRMLSACSIPEPVILEDNCWIGFGSVILPGVRIGRGAIVGSKTIISQDVPPYAVIVGEPARIIKYLDADDTEEAKQHALKKYTK